MAPRWAVLSCAYVGAVVGAGFASGQEILQFFARHGWVGLVGCVVAGVLFSLVGAVALSRIVGRQHAHYGALLRDVLGPWMGGALDRVGALALFIGLAAVVAAAGALGLALWGWTPWWGSAALVGLLVASALGGRRTLERVNLVAAPLIVLCCLAAAWTSLAAATTNAVPTPQHFGWAWFTGAILYVSYNMLLAIAGLCAACDGAERPRDAVIAGLTGGSILGLLCATVTVTLLRGAMAGTSDLPLAIVMSSTHWGVVAYPCVLVLALWTTGNAAAAALGRRVYPAGWSATAVVMTLGAFPVALFGLRAIVLHLYPIIGYCGIPLLLAFLWRALCPGNPLGKPDRAR